MVSSKEQEQQNAKKRVSAVLVGAGGVASYFLPVFLKTFNVTNLKIYDEDILEPRNLDRQHFNPNDVGRNKAEALLDHLSHTMAHHMPENVEVEDVYFTHGFDCSDYDFIICMADNHPARKACIEEAMDSRIGCYIACNQYFDSMAYYYHPDVTPIPFERYPEIETEEGGDPIRCTGEVQESTPQLAIANFSSAAKVLELMWIYENVEPTIPQDDPFKLPYELESRLSGPKCLQITNM